MSRSTHSRTFDRWWRFVWVLTLVAAGMTLAGQARTGLQSRPLTLSIVGTSDLHGYFMPRDGRGGLSVFAAYLNNLRAARRDDGGAVLLLDAGDTFQGGVESDLSEGAVVVDAYNALGYTALAVGNHEFDFGSADRPGARQDPSADPRGALKARAAQAKFPFLAANLLDGVTGRPVEWPNVRPSTIVEVGDLKVGLVGVMTANALRSTLPLNVRGLRLAPLSASVTAEATSLRARGADLVVLTAHAGGGCERFDNPEDLSTCDPNAEIFDLAMSLPHGLVTAIVAGHTHAGLAHEVNGIPIVQSFWGGRAFGRIDLHVERATRQVTGSVVFPPRDICAAVMPGGSGSTCARPHTAAVPAEYEGHPIVPDEAIAKAMAPALARVHQLRTAPLGVELDAPLVRSGVDESPLGNLYADALRERSGADIALNNNGMGGLRADLPRGAVNFGQLYDTFPFDNRLLKVHVSATALENGIANALRRGRRGWFGISGARVRVSCGATGLDVELFRPTGELIPPTASLTVVGMDSLLGGQNFANLLPPGSAQALPDAPIVREVVEDWLRAQASPIRADVFAESSSRRLETADAAPCLAQ